MGRLSKLVSLFLALSSYASATVYLDESFDDETWKDRWVQSSFKEDYGKAEVTSSSQSLNYRIMGVAMMGQLGSHIHHYRLLMNHDTNLMILLLLLLSNRFLPENTPSVTKLMLVG